MIKGTKRVVLKGTTQLKRYRDEDGENFLTILDRDPFVFVELPKQMIAVKISRKEAARILRLIRKAK